MGSEPQSKWTPEIDEWWESTKKEPQTIGDV